MQFRDRFYQQYFSNQASRTTTADLQTQHRYNCTNYRHEVLPLLPVNKNVRILELGAGYGSLQLFLQEHGYTNLAAVDLSAEQVDQARKLGATNVRQGDVAGFLNQEQQADVILGIDLLEHFTRSEALDLLDQCRQSLKPGGRVIFRCPNVDAPLGTVYAFGDLTHDLFLNRSSAEQLLLAAGFHHVQVLPSYVWTPGVVKGLIQKALWKAIRFRLRLWLFASGRSPRSAILSPNLVMTGVKA
jgi:2-polyprenyl-3-methyl-5-hydroxy-6-metoxy-1,4-benzoquinol methylase